MVLFRKSLTAPFSTKYNVLYYRLTMTKSVDVSFRAAARVFFDEDYIEEADEAHSDNEQRYNVIGDTSAGNTVIYAAIGNVERFFGDVNDILYVVYTERIKKESNGKPYEVIRLISARLANDFERGIYYGQYI